MGPAERWQAGRRRSSRVREGPASRKAEPSLRESTFGDGRLLLLPQGGALTGACTPAWAGGRVGLQPVAWTVGVRAQEEADGWTAPLASHLDRMVAGGRRLMPWTDFDSRKASLVVDALAKCPASRISGVTHFRGSRLGAALFTHNPPTTCGHRCSAHRRSSRAPSWGDRRGLVGRRSRCSHAPRRLALHMPRRHASFPPDARACDSLPTSHPRP